MNVTSGVDGTPYLLCSCGHAVNIDDMTADQVASAALAHLAPIEPEQEDAP